MKTVQEDGEMGSAVKEKITLYYFLNKKFKNMFFRLLKMTK